MPGEPRRATAFGAALLVSLAALIAILYRDALAAWFAADDFHWLEASEPGDVLRSFAGGWGHGPAYRPLARVGFLADRLAFGLDARLWHAHSLLLLALDATLFGTLLVRLSGDRVLAAAAAALFVVLPSNYENAIWISGKIHLLALALSLGSLLALDRHLLEPRPSRLAACAVAYALALLCYEAAAYTLPLAIGVAALRHRDVAPRSLRARAFAALALLAGVTLLYGVARWLAVGGATLYPMRPIADVASSGFAAHVALAAVVLAAPLGAWGFSALGAGAVVTAIVAPRLLVWVGLGVVVAAVGFAPFALVDSLPVPRFLFASGLGLALAAGAIVAGVARVRRVGPVAAVAVVALAALGPARDTAHIARDWKLAGDVGRRVLDQVAQASARFGPGRDVVVVNPPTTIGRAMLFNTYFDAAMRLFEPSATALVLPGSLLRRSERPALIAGVRIAARRRDPRPERPGYGRLLRAARGGDTDAVLAELLRRDVLFLAIDPGGHGVRPLPAATALEWLELPAARLQHTP